MAKKPQIMKIKSEVTSADILNAIRANASTDYRDYVPEVTYGDDDSLKEFGTVMMNYTPLRNEFVEALYNRIGRTIINSKMYDNPLKMFKKGVMDQGDTIEEAFVQPAEGYDFATDDPEANPFKRALPDVRSAFHVINYQKQYETTIDQNVYLRRAFLSWDGVNDLISKITDSLSTGANYDEFLITKYILALRLLNGQVNTVTVEPGDTKEVLEHNTAIMRNVSNNLTFLSNKYNLAGVLTHTPRDDQYLLVNTKYDAYSDVYVLAKAFNLDYATMLGHQVMINGFDDLDGTETDARINKLMRNKTTGEYLPGYTPLTTAQVEALNAIPAITVDKDFFQIYDQLLQYSEEYNNRRLYYNFFLTVTKVVSSSPFANAVAFIPGDNSVDSVELTPASASINAGQSVVFTAIVNGSDFAPKSVKYTLSGDGADKANISREGVLTTAKDATGTITVTAASTFDPDKTAESTVTIQA